MKSKLKKMLQIRCSGYMTVEAAYVVPFAIGVFFFCMAMFFFVYDRGVIYQNMLRQAVVTQMQQDEEKLEHGIVCLPTLSLQGEQLSMEREEEQIRVSSGAVQKNPLKTMGFMPIRQTFTSNAEATLSIHDPVSRLRKIRRAQWLAQKAEDALQK